MGIKKRSKVLVIIPVFNEATNIQAVLSDTFTAVPNMDVLVVNDGSTDDTALKVASTHAFLINHPINLGISASFETGCTFALQYGYSYIVRLDGDGQHSSVAVREVLKPVLDDGYDVSIGSRFIGNSDFKSTWLRLIGIQVLAFLLSMLTKRRVTDPTSGFCAMNRKAFSFFSNNCADDYPEPEILLHHRNLRITEVPISMKPRQSGVSSITPIRSLYYILKIFFLVSTHIFRKDVRCKWIYDSGGSE